MLNSHIKKNSTILIAIFLTSCSFLYEPELIIDQELTPEFLRRLSAAHGDHHVFYFIASNKSLVTFNDSGESVQDQIINYVHEEIKNRGICKSDPVLDKTGSWVNERDDLYINFFCED